MDNIEKILTDWRASSMKVIPVRGLQSRNEIAYKWKAPFRSWVLRETAHWRVTDLLTQSYAMHKQGHGLGARILLRSAFETLAVLFYLNHNMRAVLHGVLNFHDFSDLTIRQIAGTKNDPKRPVAVNVITMLTKGDKLYPGLKNMYDDLCESAHPNYEGMMLGYSTIDHDEYEIHFSNRWMDLYGERNLTSMELCMMTFYHEYNVVWIDLMEQLESWIVENDKILEATKNTPEPD